MSRFLERYATENSVLSPWAVVVRIRNGLIVESHSYLSEEELLDELGLLGGHPPQPDP